MSPPDETAGDPGVKSETFIYARVCEPHGAHPIELRLERYVSRDDAGRLGKAVIMVHGGAWTSNDRHSPHVVCRNLAEAGFSVFSLDFRDGRDGKHPCAVQDVTAGIRYVRARAEQFGIDADGIALIGSSSGGHLALLTAIQPDVPEYRGTSTAIAGGDDLSAGVCCVVALWPVSNPERRLRHAIETGRDELVQAHFGYYRDEAHMRDASVQRRLRAGEAQSVPPLLVVQPGEDANVPRDMTLDLVREYQEAGGTVHYLFYPGLRHGFAYEASVATTRLLEEIHWFIKRYTHPERALR
ncbi:MAG: alpha/beta hydrolase [Gammaproteobacteria bacterium]|nr:alpha/beta hydrolase [Gammaproteobacteria bacterium]